MPLSNALGRAQRFLDARFSGSAPALPLALFRVAFALLVLVRSNDLTRGILRFHHHYWLQGLEYDPASDPLPPIALVSPLIPGLGLGALATRLLVWVRTLASLTLLLGVRARLSALVLGVAGYWLMVADRYRYLHHLQLLWLTALWLALVPSDARLSLLGWLRKRPRVQRVPRWSLQALRLLCASVYLSAGSAKLDARWLNGDTLRELEQLTLIGGPHWQRVVALLGYRGTAYSVCALELALLPLLYWKKTRYLGIALGALLHAILIPSMMEVATFNAQMLLLLALFAIPDRPAAADTVPINDEAARLPVA